MSLNSNVHIYSDKSSSLIALQDFALIEAVHLSKSKSLGVSIDWNTVAELLNEKSAVQWSEYWSMELLPKVDAMPRSKYIETDSPSSCRITSEDISILEASRLFDGQGKSGGIHWKRVARHLGKQRTSKEYRTHWKQTVRPNLQASVANLTAALSRAARKRGSSADAVKPEKRIKNKPEVSSTVLISNAVESQYTAASTVPDSSTRTSISTKLTNKSLSSTDYLLIEAVQLYDGLSLKKGVDWAKVAEHMKSGKTAHQWYRYWIDILKPSLSGISYEKWTDKEDQIIISNVEKYRKKTFSGGVRWSKLARDLFENKKSANQCRTRWNQFLHARLKGARTGPWNMEEDMLLREGMALYSTANQRGGISWVKISEHMGERRSAAQVRARWNSLNVAQARVTQDT